MWVDFSFFDCFLHAISSFVIDRTDLKSIRLVCTTWNEWLNRISIPSLRLTNDERFSLHSLSCFDVQILIALENFKALPESQKYRKIAEEAKKKKENKNDQITDPKQNAVVQKVIEIDGRALKVLSLKDRMVKRVLRTVAKKADDGELVINVALNKYCQVTKMQIVVDEYEIFKEAFQAAVISLKEDKSLAFQAVGNIDERNIAIAL